MKRTDTIRRALLASLPVMAGYLTLGIGFGVLLYSKGFGAWWAFFISLFVYAGSMQYVAVDLLAGGASLVTAAITTLMVNARHLLYGTSVLERYRGAGKAKPYLIFALTDETYSLVCADAIHNNEEDRHRYDFWVSLFNHIYWVTGSVIGGLIGGALPFDVEGIEFALTALFVTIFTEQWLSTKDHAAALIGVGCSVLCLLLCGPDRFLIPAMVVISIALLLLRQRKGAQ